MSDINLTNKEKDYLNRGNSWEGVPGYETFYQDPLDDVTPETWEACKPKLPDSNNWGVPLIFGTGGEDKWFEKASFWAEKSLNLQEAIDFERSTHWTNPKAPVEYGKDISKEDLEDIVGVIKSKSRRSGFNDSLEKQKTLDEFESKIWIEDSPIRKRGTNKMKPKKRRKK